MPKGKYPQPQPGRRRASQLYVLALGTLGIKAWNATRDDKPLKVLGFRTTEDFPTL